MKKIILLLLLLLSNSIFAQSWILQANIPSASFISAHSVNGQICWMIGGSTICWRTTNGGVNWLDCHGNLSSGDAFTVFALDANTAWIGGSSGHIYKTTNGGVLWTSISPTPITPCIDGIHFFNTNTGFAVGDPPLTTRTWRFWTTTNAGLNWIAGANAPIGDTIGEGCPTNSVYVIDTGHIWWVSNEGSMYCGGLHSTFSILHSLHNGILCDIAFQNYTTGVVLQNSGDLPMTNMRLTQGCGAWTSTSYTPPAFSYDLKTAPSTNSSFYWIASGHINNTAGYISRSTDNGITFSQQLSLTTTSVRCLAVVNVDTAWAGCWNGNIYKYIATDPIGIKVNSRDVPVSFSLAQNYPNPFNPSTIITYQLPMSSDVNLIVYDILGHEVKTLVNKKQSAGSYQVEFSATGGGSDLASGVYFYKLQTTEFTETKSMILIK